MTKKFRFMTGLLAVVLAFVMLSSVAYIAAESDHDCTGVDCAICHQINVCENLLKSIGLAGSAAATVAAILYILCRIIPSCTDAERVQQEDEEIMCDSEIRTLAPAFRF